MPRAYTVSTMVGAVLLLAVSSVSAATRKQVVVDDVVIDLKRPGAQVGLAAGLAAVEYRPAYYSITPRITAGSGPLDQRVSSSVSPNTVFILSSSSLLNDRLEGKSAICLTAVMGVSMGTRIDTRIDARVDARLIGRVPAAHLGFVGGVEPGSELSLWSTSDQGPTCVPGSIKGKLSIRCTEPTRPATSATTPPVNARSIESSDARVSR